MEWARSLSGGRDVNRRPVHVNPSSEPAAVDAAAAAAPSARVQVRDLTVTAPSGRPLLRHVNLTVLPGGFPHSVLITGPSGCGKSTLLRRIAGCAPSAHGDEGAVTTPPSVWQAWDGPGGGGGGGVGRRGADSPTASGASVMFVPQRPYVFEASLRALLLYPAVDTSGAVDDLELLRLLRSVHLDAVVNKVTEGRAASGTMACQRRRECPSCCVVAAIVLFVAGVRGSSCLWRTIASSVSQDWTTVRNGRPFSASASNSASPSSVC